MPTVKVPLFAKIQRNVDGVEVNAETASAIDVYRDEKGFLCRRPGLSQFVDLGLGANKPINGLFWWEDRACLIACAGGKVFKVTYPGGVATTSDITGDALNSNQQVSITKDGPTLYLSNGGEIVTTDGSTATAYLADAQAPAASDSLAFLDLMILSNEVGTKQMKWSDVGNGLAWDALSLIQASSDSDNLDAVHVLDREVFLFGNSSTEIWEHDGETPFARLPGGALSEGCIAKESIVSYGGEFFWLNHKRKFVRCKGRQISPISTPYTKEIEKYSSVSDCVGSILDIAGQVLIVWTFPTQDKTLVYNLNLDDWSEWRFWNAATLSSKRWKGQCYAYSPDWGIHFVGDNNQSIIYALSVDTYTDNGSEIVSICSTGHVDYGSSKRKKSKAIRFRTRRGVGLTGNLPAKMFYRVQDDNGPWSIFYELSLGASGDSEIPIEDRPMGVYRTRKYEFHCSDPVPFLIGEVEEDIDLLSS